MSSPNTTKTWLLANKPTGDPVLSGPDATFELSSKDLPALKPNQALVKVKYISNDPAQRGWIDPNISPEKLYTKPVEQGTTMHARGIGEVVDSQSEKFKKGSWVQGNFGWSEYAIIDDKDESYRDAPELPGGLSRTHYLGALGLTGLTAYYGLVVVAEAKKGEKILVSGAAGATGSMVVQIAKHIVGASNVIGLAGTDEKCRWVEKIGADKCLNYKSKTFDEDLKAATKDGVDVFFDNVGGEILDKGILTMSKHGRIAQCGAVSSYNKGNAFTSKNYFLVVTMRLQIRGFIVLDWLEHAGEALKIFREALQDGRLNIGDENETVVDTKFEDVPKTWTMLFDGGNTGKLVTNIV